MSHVVAFGVCCEIRRLVLRCLLLSHDCHVLVHCVLQTLSTMPKTATAREFAVVAECNRVATTNSVVQVAVITNMTKLARALYQKECVAFAYCNSVWRICTDHQENRVSCGEATVELLQDILKHYSGVVNICEEAMLASLNLMVDTDANKTAFLKLGGVDILRQMMDAFAASNNTLAGYGCGICWTLSSLPGAADQVHEGDMLPRILAAMEQYSADADLQKRALGALVGLCRCRAGKLAVLASGARDLANRVHEAHPHDTSVQSQYDSLVSKLETVSLHELRPLKVDMFYGSD